MTLYALSIRRPVLATVMSLVIVIFGLLAFTFLGVREYPAVDPPVISVSTSYRGANADVIDSQITEPIEESVNGIDGVEMITSTSREGRSTVRVEFALGADLERAANDVRDRVSRAISELPPDVEPPVVSKADADRNPILFLGVESSTRNLLELTEIADTYFKERLQTIPGVSSVDIWGEKMYSMRLWLDPQKLAAHNLTPLDVQQAVARSNVELPSGRIEGQAVELTVRTLGRLNTVQDFENMILHEDGGHLVRFRDVGRVELGPENARSILKRNGVPMVGVVLRPLPGANYISIVDEFYNRLESLRADMPPDIHLEVGFDNTQEIRKSITEVRDTILIAFLLVVGVIFFFLRDWRTTIIPIVVIPISLIGAFFVMYAADFSVNVLTLLAIVLAIGIVVDDAIVVLENIYAKLEGGLEPVEAGITGTREIFFAVIATTLALVAVFLPIIFLGGLTGRLFREFGIVIAGSVLISAFVALTLTPMLATKLLRRKEHENRFYQRTEPFFQKMTATYRGWLETFMRHRWAAFAVMAACAGLMILFFNALPAELAPLEDRS
ncbi:MAG TPA: efflux RND transporter permease subunit, partial [Rhodothermales bacterium]